MSKSRSIKKKKEKSGSRFSRFMDRIDIVNFFVILLEFFFLVGRLIWAGVRLLLKLFN